MDYTKFDIGLHNEMNMIKQVNKSNDDFNQRRCDVISLNVSSQTIAACSLFGVM